MFDRNHFIPTLFPHPDRGTILFQEKAPAYQTLHYNFLACDNLSSSAGGTTNDSFAFVTFTKAESRTSHVARLEY